MHAILITQCIQQDFIAPLGWHDPLPNLLHVGPAESRRLLGSAPETGPVAQVMAWARQQPPASLTVIHVRDWHDDADPAQQEHLARFGTHCVQGTPGAALVLGLDEGLGARSGEHVVDSIALNDFEGTRLPVVLGELLAAHGGPSAVRVAVIGVWTEAKVSFLLYDLRTRLGVERLATCSALTASASRAQHFNALEQLRRLLGVDVLDTVGELADWLVPGSADGAAAHHHAAAFGAAVEVLEGPALSPTDRSLVQLMYRESARVELAPLSGGFSGAAVYRVRSFDALGHEEAASVAKLGPRALVGKERVAFERVEAILGNDAPSVRASAELGERAGLKYSYAAMGQGRVRTFKALYEGGAPDAEIERVLRVAFEEILGRFYRAAHYERLPLLSYYGFAPRHAPGLRAHIHALLGEQAAEASELVFGGAPCMNLADFYADFLPTVQEGAEHHYVSWVHGDLNGANILVDGRDNVWLIDFFHAARGHVLRDLAKLENDLLYIFTKLHDEDELEQALALTQALRRIEDLRAPLPPPPAALTAPALRRAWATLRVLRGIGAVWCREDRSTRQLSIALLRYASHTLSFDESSQLQKRWALAAACGHATDIRRSMLEERELRVDWIAAEVVPGGGRLGLTICPGRQDRGRSLPADLDRLVAQGASRLVGFMTRAELDFVGVAGLADAAAARQITYQHLPIPDQAPPALPEAAALVEDLRVALARGEAVVLHCMGGLGRSGTLAACLLVRGGLSAADAITRVRDARGPRAVESPAQEAFVRTFEHMIRSSP